MTRLPHDPSIGGILLGDNNKSDESIFLFDGSFFFSRLEFFCGEKLAMH